MPMGDSITAGFNDPEGTGGYRCPLGASLANAGYSVNFVGSQAAGPCSDNEHEGHGGYTIAQIDAIAATKVALFAPAVVLLMIGTNDIGTGIESGAITRLGTLIDHIQVAQAGVKIVVATIPHRTDDAGLDTKTTTLNGQITSMVSTRAGLGQLIYQMTTPLDTALSADGVHPSTTGYGQIAGAWFTVLQEVL